MVLWMLCQLHVIAVTGLSVDELAYREEEPEGYTIRVMTDPCKFADSATCCSSSYGAME